MDGILRRTDSRHFSGTLNGYTVQIGWLDGLQQGWSLWIATPRYTVIATRVASPAEGARVAREWIEAHPLRPITPDYTR